MAKIDSLDSGVQKDCNVITMARTLISIRDKGSGSLSELVLTRLTDTDIYNMCEYMDLITLDSDDIICEKNSTATFFAIVLDGVVKSKHGENKAKWKVIKKSVGYVIGYEQAFEGGLRSKHIAVESEQCKILSMPLHTLDQMSVFNPLLAMKIKGGFAACIIHELRKERPSWLPKEPLKHKRENKHKNAKQTSSSGKSKKGKKKANHKRRFHFRSAQRNPCIAEDKICNDYEEILYQSNQKEIEKTISEAQLAAKHQRSRDIQDREAEKYSTIRELRKSWS
jgi:hypothetical protein